MCNIQEECLRSSDCGHSNYGYSEIDDDNEILDVSFVTFLKDRVETPSSQTHDLKQKETTK